MDLHECVCVQPDFPTETAADTLCRRCGGYRAQAHDNRRPVFGPSPNRRARRAQRARARRRRR